MRRLAAALALVALVLGLASMPRMLASHTAVGPDFVHFESGHVHPAALTPSGNRLLVVNTPDNRLSVFDLTGAAPVRIAEIPVGLEPVSVAALDDGEAWVVNNLSDDVSIVDLGTLHVRRTLRVGDEPSDVVFAGTPTRAFVSVSQEDRVKVYDPADLAAAPSMIPIPGRMPRALARNAAGTLVYVSVFHAGNRTSVIAEADMPNDSFPVDPQYLRNPAIPTPRPRTGLIVGQDGAGDWRDMYGKLWNYLVDYDMREADIAEVATATQTVSRTFGDLGTVNFALAVSPTDGRIALGATEARNLQRLEPRLRGHLVDTRVGVVTAAGTKTLLDLNPHVHYEVLPGTQAERDSAIGIPNGAAFSADGQRLYVTSLASDRLAVLDPTAASGALAMLARVPTVAGPTGVVVDAARGRLYVVGRFRNQLQTLSASSLSSLAVTSIGFDPTPNEIVNGRRFFYGGFTSAHGDQACATCHVFGDFDNIAWDLGDPGGSYLPAPPGMLDPFLEGFDPEKGPMVTQSLRGLPGTGVLHWRGDRANLAAFNPAFVSLLGRETALPDSQMAAFSDFVMALAYPPNPAQYLDRTMPDAPQGQPSALRGQNFFLTFPAEGAANCVTCHAITTGTSGQIINDEALAEDQDIKIPQLRNLYKKTGFSRLPGAINTRGFGFIHDGSIDNLFNFLQFPGFNFGQPQAVANANRRDVEAFLLAFDTGMPPSVGYQITFHGANNGDPTTRARFDSLKTQYGICDVVAKGRVGGQPRGWVYRGNDLWLPDKNAEPDLPTAQLVALAGPGSEVTVTGVPLGTGDRAGVDRDRDTFLDGDELDAGSDPGDPTSTPGSVAVSPQVPRAGFDGARPNPFRGSTDFAFTLGRASPVSLVVYDLLGREVRPLVRGVAFEAGTHRVAWDGRIRGGGAAPAGVYFARFETPDGSWTRPVLRIH